jgi:hypothetical protein
VGYLVVHSKVPNIVCLQVVVVGAGLGGKSDFSSGVASCGLGANVVVLEAAAASLSLA